MVAKRVRVHVARAEERQLFADDPELQLLERTGEVQDMGLISDERPDIPRVVGVVAEQRNAPLDRKPCSSFIASGSTESNVFSNAPGL